MAAITIKRSVRGLIPAFILSICLLLALLWNDDPAQLAKQLFESSAPLEERQKLSTLSNSSSRHYSDEGFLKHSVHSIEVERFEPREGLPDAVLQSPQFELFSLSKLESDQQASYRTEGPQPFWTITASRAEGRERRSEWLLQGNVRVVRSNWSESQLEGESTILHTESLRILVNERYAETDQSVTIESPRGRTSAMGMKIFFDEERIELTAQVFSKLLPLQAEVIE